MTMTNESKYLVNMEYAPVQLPPVHDILVLGRKYPHGKAGVMECFRFIAPDEFEMFDIPDAEEVAEAVLVNKRILARVPAEQVIELLRTHVFPHMTRGEAINVDFDVRVIISGVEIPRETR